MKYWDDKFLLITAEPYGCFVCDPTQNPEAHIFNSVEELVSHLDKMVNNKTMNTYPVELRYLDCDGAIDEDVDIELSFKSGCLSNGLVEVSFKLRGLKYKLKRDNKKLIGKERNDR